MEQNQQIQKLTENMNKMTSSRVEKKTVLQNCPKMKMGENLEIMLV